MFGIGRPKMSSEEKIAMAEQEMRLLADMHNRYASPTAEQGAPEDSIAPQFN